jgi:hypothetical protein
MLADIAETTQHVPLLKHATHAEVRMVLHPDKGKIAVVTFEMPMHQSRCIEEYVGKLMPGVPPPGLVLEFGMPAVAENRRPLRPQTRESPLEFWASRQEVGHRDPARLAGATLVQALHDNDATAIGRVGQPS